MQFGPQPTSKRLISLTPLIDVVFILLVFFMLASSYLDWRAVEMKVSSGARAATSTQQAIRVRLLADGSMSFERRSVDRATLAKQIAVKLADDREKRIVILPETGVPLQRAVEILDTLRSVGATNVSLSRSR